MIDAIDAVRVRGDSVGGVVTCIARNVPKVCFTYLIIVHGPHLRVSVSDLFLLSTKHWALFLWTGTWQSSVRQARSGAGKGGYVFAGYQRL
jgi:hypothetical protein